MDPRKVPVAAVAGPIVAAGVCLVVSLFLPCIYLQDDPVPFIGLALFLWGPLGLLDGVVAWYANVFLPLSAVLLWTRRYRLAALCGIPALALALSTLGMHRILVNERPDYETITGYGVGFYLWLASIAIVPASALVLAVLTGKRPKVVMTSAELVTDTPWQKTPGSAGGPA
jgi:hypothetical protein